MATFEAGERLYTIGYNMACKPVVVRVVFTRMNEDGRVVARRGTVSVIGGPPEEYFRDRKDAVAYGQAKYGSRFGMR